MFYPGTDFDSYCGSPYKSAAKELTTVDTHIVKLLSIFFGTVFLILLACYVWMSLNEDKLRAKFVRSAKDRRGTALADTQL